LILGSPLAAVASAATAVRPLWIAAVQGRKPRPPPSLVALLRRGRGRWAPNDSVPMSLMIRAVVSPDSVVLLKHCSRHGRFPRRADLPGSIVESVARQLGVEPGQLES
jgi:hypothetical protein